MEGRERECGYGVRGEEVEMLDEVEREAVRVVIVNCFLLLNPL